jgi:hypothetical protein
MGDLAGIETAWDAFQAQPNADAAARKGSSPAGRTVGPADQSVRSRPACRRRPARTGQWRVDGPLANLPAFGAAFSCKAGQPMQLPEAAGAHLALSRRRSGHQQRKRRPRAPFAFTQIAMQAMQVATCCLRASHAAQRRPLAAIAAERRLPAPVADHQPAEQHAAQMGEMRHARLQPGEAEEQFGHAVQDHEVRAFIGIGGNSSMICW